MIRWIRVAVALVLVLALSASVYWGYTLFLLATGLIVLGVAYGWPRLTDSPQPRATSIMLALFGVAGLYAAWQDSTAPYLDWLPVLAGLGLLWTFVQNLTRGIGASYAVANVSAQVSGLVIVLSASTWVAAITVPGDKEAIVIGLASLIVAQCMTALPWPAIYTSPLAIVMSTAVAGILSVLVFARRSHCPLRSSSVSSWVCSWRQSIGCSGSSPMRSSRPPTSKLHRTSK